MMRRLVSGALVAGLLAACGSDGADPVRDPPLAVSWLEWPAAVTASEHGTIRAVGYMGCGALRLSVEQSGPSAVLVSATQHFADPDPPPCPPTIYTFDTVVPLPRLVSPTGPTGQFTINAVNYDALAGYTLRSYGVVQLTDQQFNAALQAAGRVRVKADSLGCSWAQPDILGWPGAFVLASDVTLSTNSWQGAFVSGEFSAALAPRCGQDPLLQLHLLEVDNAAP